MSASKEYTGGGAADSIEPSPWTIARAAFAPMRAT